MYTVCVLVYRCVTVPVKECALWVSTAPLLRPVSYWFNSKQNKSCPKTNLPYLYWSKLKIIYQCYMGISICQVDTNHFKHKNYLRHHSNRDRLSQFSLKTIGISGPSYKPWITHRKYHNQLSLRGCNFEGWYWQEYDWLFENFISTTNSSLVWNCYIFIPCPTLQ